MTEPTDAATSPLIHLTTSPPAPKPAAAAPKEQSSAAEWQNLSPQQRAEHQRSEIDALHGTFRPEGFKPGVKIDAASYEKLTNWEKTQYAAQFSPKPGADPNAPPADPVADPNGPRIKVGEADFAEAEVLAALAEKAAKDANLLSLPARPADYKLELPADFKAPEGVTFTFNEKDPIKGPVLTSAREFALANKLTQEQFSGMLGLYAASEAHNAKMIADGFKIQKDLLGAAGTARIDAISRFLKAELGDDGARPFLQTLVTAKMVDGWERFIQKKTAQGAGSFSRRGNEPPEAEGKVDQATYDAMSYGQKKEYAERFSGSGNSRRGA